MKISFAITVCNEINELILLIDHLEKNMDAHHEIIVQYDSDSVTDTVLEYLSTMRHIKSVGFPLNKDFGSFKNNLSEHCTGDYIFQIDADERPHETLVKNLEQILILNSEIDIFMIPRVNIVNGITNSHLNRWRWRQNDKGWINFPDLQTRIYKNDGNVKWINKVHERLTKTSGEFKTTSLPHEPDMALWHVKDIKKQEQQNDFYAEI